MRGVARTVKEGSAVRRGFTLIELLVVVAIIAILAAILFPVFARTREKARQASCQSNLKQIGLAFAMYKSDFDEKYMPCRQAMLYPDPRDVSKMIYYSWPHLLQPYIGNWQILTCPSMIEGLFYCHGGDVALFSYGRNLGYFNGDRMTLYEISDTQIAQPSQCINVFDNGLCNRPGPRYIRWPGNGLAPVDWASQSLIFAPATVHNGGANFLFYDGHVKFGRRDQWTAGYYTAERD